MRKMKDSYVKWIGQIHEDWDLIPNRYLFIDHSTKVGEQSHKYQLLSLTTMGVKEKNINVSGGKVPETYDNYQTVEPGDMIFCLFDLDCSAVFSGLSNCSGMITSAYDVLKPNPIYLDNLYADFWFQYVFSNRYYKIYSKNIRYTITTDMFKSIMTLIPPIETQRKIGKFLFEKHKKIEDLIANQQAQIEKLKEYKQSVITEAVTKGLDSSAPMKDSGVDWIGEIPENWEILRIKNIGWTQNGISKGGDYFGQGYPFVSYGDVYKNIVLPESVDGLIETTEQERNNYSVQENDIFFTRTSETIEEVGFSCVCKKTITNATFAGFLIRLRLFNNKKICIDYAKYYFRGTQIRKYLVKEMNIVTRASLGQDLLKAMSVTLPPMIEQQQIADYLDKKCVNIDSLISIKKQKIEKLKEYKKSLIYEYVTGKKEVV